jgi:hypothetical protein
MLRPYEQNNLRKPRKNFNYNSMMDFLMKAASVNQS